MRVLMTSDAIGGVWTYVLELCRALAGEGVEFIVATMGPPPDARQRRAAAACGNIRLVESTYRLEWMEHPWEDVALAGQWLLKLEQQHAPDVIHLNGYAHGALPWQAPVVMVGHSCVLSWWRAVKKCEAPPQWNTYRAMTRHGISRANLIVAPSRDMLGALRANYGPLPSSRVIYNGRAPDFGKSRKQPLIFSAGRFWDEAKNLAALESVAGKVAWPIFIAGDQASPALTHLSSRKTVALGQLDPSAVASWLSRAAIYALPARYEPFGLSILEAALCGCALVLGDIPSLREVWGGAAMYVPPDDHQALHDALDNLAQHPGQRRAMGAAARQHALMYCPQRMASAYWSAYRHLVSTANGADRPNAAHGAADYVQPF